jgi:hypothetical protein
MRRFMYGLLAVVLVGLATETAAAQSQAQPPLSPPAATPPGLMQSPGQAGLPTYAHPPSHFQRRHRVYPVYPFYYNPWYTGYYPLYSYGLSGQYWYAYYPSPYSSSPVVVRYVYGPGYAYYYYVAPTY